MKHLLGALVLVAVLATATVYFFRSVDLLPVQASAESIVVDDLFDLTLDIIAVLFALIAGLMLYSVVVFRRRSPDDIDGRHIHGNTSIEVLWSVIPLVIVLWLGYHSVGELTAITSAKDNELIVDVTAEQWQWSFTYPEQNITSSTLVLPKDRTALLRITGKDVLHSFWVVEFRLKQDAVPGLVVPLRITPNLVGEYKVRCAEVCGAGHTTMWNDVLVVEEAEFETALADAASGRNLAPDVRGAKIAKDRGCLACHSIDGKKIVGPTWKDLVGRREDLADGTSVTVDAAYIEESIKDPSANIVQGFQDVMPKTFGEQLTDEDIDAIIAYMTTLSPGAGGN